ncbi:MAG: hypothetical protein HY907_06160 [Deltaproteobacteria bacterium]|nr:hypothetical protein [Deltaproteobacteria bacterium]
MMHRGHRAVFGLTCLSLLACGPAGSSGDAGDVAADAVDALDVTEEAEAFVCNSPPGEEFADDRFYHPWAVLPSSEVPAPRDWQLRRGIIHIHSPYSHDGCDNEPFTDGVRNEECFQQLRQALCDTGQDFAFLTDHATLFADHEFPDILLYAPGDTLIERDGNPVANRMACPDGREIIIAAGTEQGSMPIGLEHHVGDTPAERHDNYNDTTPAGIEALKAAGAVALVQHTEGWPVEELLAMPLDGFEIYNLHFNLEDGIAEALSLLTELRRAPCRVPVPELGLVPIWRENDADLLRWSRALAIRRSAGVLATDVHRNTFNGTSPDGERIDSFRRLTHWFSNYVLLPAGAVDDVALKDAIRRGRLYGGFDYLGYPVGFDFHAEAAGTFYEMGDEVPAGETVVLRVVAPTVSKLDPDGPQPVITARILRSDDGTWMEVATGQGTVELPAAPVGVYRADVRIVPEHLRPWLGLRADTYVVDHAWVYSNPIYVGVSWPPAP